METVFYLPIIESGKYLDLDIITYYLIRTVKIPSEKPLLTQVDGESMLADSYEISLEKNLGFWWLKPKKEVIGIAPKPLRFNLYRIFKAVLNRLQTKKLLDRIFSFASFFLNSTN